MDTHTIVVGAGTGGATAAGLLAEHGSEPVLLLEAGPDYGPLTPVAGPPTCSTRASSRCRTTGATDRGPTPTASWTSHAPSSSAAAPPTTAAPPRSARRRLGRLGRRATPAGARPTWSRCWTRCASASGSADTRWTSSPRSSAPSWTPASPAGSRSPTTSWHRPRARGSARCRSTSSTGCAGTRVRVPGRVRDRLDRSPAARQSTALLFEDGRVTGDRRSTGRELRAGRVIVAGGAYHSPAILLRSGIGPADELRALGIDVVVDLPGVGAHLLDHACVAARLRGLAGPVRGARRARS